MKQEQNKMGTKPVKVLLLTMGLPMILSMVVQAFYNIVDSYFVSAIGEGADEAVHALTLAFPIQMLMVAVGVGTGIGVSAWISQYLGMNNRERASPAGRQRRFFWVSAPTASFSSSVCS